jgi:hypothetical protein
MDEEVEHDHREDRKRNCDNAYPEETYYLLHHLVRKEKRGNLKWPMVFDRGGPHSTPHMEIHSTKCGMVERLMWKQGRICDLR